MSSNMPFQLSIGAKNVEARFYGKIAIVNVEGEDDLHFWAQYFDQSIFEIRPVGGCENLIPIISDILNKGLRSIVARDADYSFYSKDGVKHPLIISTKSHSIENVMYCPENVNHALQKLSRNFKDYKPEIEVGMNTFFDEVRSLVIYDIVNNVYKHGISVLGDSCARFLKSSKSIKVDSSKVDTFLNGLSFPKDETDAIDLLVSNDPRPKYQIIKGHFLTSYIINLLKKIVHDENKGSVEISKDMLYSLLVNCSSNCRFKKTCSERRSIQIRVAKAKKHLDR